MKEFLVKDYHQDFIKYCDTNISNLNTSIHKCFKEVTNIIIMLENKYYNYLIKYSINLKDLLNNNIVGKPLQYSIIDEENIFISEYNYLLLKLLYLPIASKNINKFSLYKSIPLSIYKQIVFNCNFEQTRNLIKGEIVDIPKIGELLIIRVPYDSSKPDWGASTRFKEYLKENGHTIKDKDNPKGKLWLVDNGLDRDDFTLVRWAKRNSKLKNKQQYRFRPSVFGNFYPKSLDRSYTIKEILDKTDTGLSDKINHIYRFHYKYTQNNYPFYTFNKSTD